MRESHLQQVSDFTRATGFEIPEKPKIMGPEALEFISSMILDEVLELLSTEYDASDAKALLHSIIERAKNLDKLITSDPCEKIAAQGDALVDIEYYMHNHALKHGIDTDEIFSEVHQANMRKIDPGTGRVIRDPRTGKVLKPPGWREPDITALIRKRLNSVEVSPGVLG